MKEDQIQYIFNQFQHKGEFLSHQELLSGHINDTFFIETNQDSNYVLQRINHLVFKNVPKLIQNKVLISKHLQSKSDRTILEFVCKKNSDQYYIIQDNNFWNLMRFIENSKVYTVVPNDTVAFEAGKLLGNFLNDTADFDAHLLYDVIPDFHNMKFRFWQFEEAFKNAKRERLQFAKKWIENIRRLEKEMLIIQNLKDENKIPIRVTHNDTKVSNCLFTANDKGLCMIDLDTVMKGIIHYDFGDALRSICNTAKEDETDLNEIQFQNEFYHAYKTGFLEKYSESITPLEMELLPLSVKTMIFIMGLRFLTDFLNNDLYYKTEYEHHNLDRAANQFTLIQRLETQFHQL